MSKEGILEKIHSGFSCEDFGLPGNIGLEYWPKEAVYRAMTEYAHQAIEEAAKEAVGQIGYDHDDQAPSAVRMKQSILKLKEKY